MRDLLKKNYRVIYNMLKETHIFEEILRKTYNYKKSRTGHQRLKNLVKSECVKAKTVDYGLRLPQGKVLQIANTDENRWLL